MNYYSKDVYNDLKNINKCSFFNEWYSIVEPILLSDEFQKYRVRWDKLSKNIEAVSKDVKDINITTDKITSRFAKVNEVNLQGIENKGSDYNDEE